MIIMQFFRKYFSFYIFPSLVMDYIIKQYITIININKHFYKFIGFFPYIRNFFYIDKLINKPSHTLKKHIYLRLRKQ